MSKPTRFLSNLPPAAGVATFIGAASVLGFFAFPACESRSERSDRSSARVAAYGEDVPTEAEARSQAFADIHEKNVDDEYLKLKEEIDNDLQADR